MLGGLSDKPSQAAGPSGTPTDDSSVSIEVTGTIQSITKGDLTLSDGTVIQITSQTVSPVLVVGQTITATVEMDGENLVAVSVVIGTPTDSNSLQATLAATVKAGKGKNSGDSTDGSTNDNSGNGGNSKGGNGKGKGGSGDSANGSTNDNSGNGGNGKGGNGKGKGKNTGTDTPDATKSANGGNDGNDLTTCLSNTKQPVATQLAQILNVPYVDIMTWHCNGNGFAEIAKAYFIAQDSSLSIDAIFGSRKNGESWDQIATDAGISLNDLVSGLHLKHKKDKGQ